MIIDVTLSSDPWHPCMELVKVMKLKESGNKYTYFLHYMGWNSRWDKWVAESDLMAAGPEAQEMQKQLKEKQQQEKVRGTHGVLALGDTRGNMPRGGGLG